MTDHHPRRPSPSTTPATRAAILHLWASGLSCRRSAQTLGCACGLVRRVLHQATVDFPSTPPTSPRHP